MYTLSYEILYIELYKSSTRCILFPYKFFILNYIDIQLDVKGCKDVYDSFDKYVELEQFPTEQDGLQVIYEEKDFSFLFSS
jgi:hypothetical protein